MKTSEPPSCIDCGAEIIDAHRSDQVRCKDCAHEHALVLKRRRTLTKRVGEGDLEAALIIQAARRESLQDKRLWLMAQYEAHEAKKHHQAS